MKTWPVLCLCPSLHFLSPSPRSAFLNFSLICSAFDYALNRIENGTVSFGLVIAITNFFFYDQELSVCVSVCLFPPPSFPTFATTQGTQWPLLSHGTPRTCANQTHSLLSPCSFLSSPFLIFAFSRLLRGFVSATRHTNKWKSQTIKEHWDGQVEDRRRTRVKLWRSMFCSLVRNQQTALWE